MLPSIAVVIPARNARETVAAAVHSALRQSHPPAAVLVIDDASDDDTAGVAREAGAAVLELNPRRGAAGARHAGAQETASACISFLDADDALDEDYLRRAAQVVARRRDLSLVLGQSIEHRADGTLHRLPTYTPAQLRRPLWSLAWNNLVPTSATVVPRWAYERSGGFDPEFPGTAAEDFDLWIRLAQLGPFGAVEGVAVHRQIRTSSWSRRPEAMDLMLRNGLVAVARQSPPLRERAPWFPRVACAQVYREAARRSLSAGLVERAQHEIRLALRCNPTDPDLWPLWLLAALPPAARDLSLRVRKRAQDARARLVRAG